MKIGDKVWFSNALYKIIHIYDDGAVKLRRKNKIVYRVDTKHITLLKNQT